MKCKTIAVLSLLMLFSNVVAPEVSAAAKDASDKKKMETAEEKAMRLYKESLAKEAARKKKEDAKKTIWDDNSNPYFKNNKPKKTKPEKVEEDDKKSTFKRRVYTGPRKEEIFKKAIAKAKENFALFMASEEYTVEYGNISYNVESDTLSVDELTAVPKRGNANVPPVPYLIKMKELTLWNFNIGQVEDTPMLKDAGELTARKIEIPIWNEKRIKKGKVEIANLYIIGEIANILKAKEGKFKSFEVKGLRSEKIINEAVLSNIVRSKVFAASSADFKNGEMKKELVSALKEQSLSGFTFSEARVNGQHIPTFDGVLAALTSYSARILNADMVWGARLEAKKGKNAEADPEQFKKNVEENKAAIKELENQKNK